MNECVKHSDAIWRGVNHTHALAHEIRRAAKHKKSRRKRARTHETPSAFAVMLEVIILLATLRLCHAPFNIGADTMEDALEMPAASTITAMAFAATALALGRKRLLSTSVSTPPPVPLRLFRRTVDSSALPADPADPKSGYDLPSPASASGAGGPSFDIDSDAEECEDYDESAADDSDEHSGGALPIRKSTGKLWSKAQFPEGTSGAKNWDMSNLLAAQTWVCPCPDRRNCIGSERVPLLDLYEHRKAFRTKAGAKGGLRDANRIEMQGHYDAKTTSFTRSFVVGSFGDCCSASAGLANGLSFCQWANSRADLRGGKPWHAGRCDVASKQLSEQRVHLESYIRELRSKYEGPKGGSNPRDKWTVPKASAAARWDEYSKMRRQKGLPVIGSKSLFEKLWKGHTEITEIGAKGHAKCDSCGDHLVDRAVYEGRMDAEAKSKINELDERHARHMKEQKGERDYAEDWWTKAEHHPGRVTALSMDAPTETQFDVPVQQRTAFDPVKSVDGAKRWSSKITGLMMAGIGMLTFVSRDGLGSGPNLSCTVLYLGMLHIVATTGVLGATLNVLLDNTGGDNKNNEMIFFLAWLVAIDAVDESSFFCMMKGHTFLIPSPELTRRSELSSSSC